MSVACYPEPGPTTLVEVDTTPPLLTVVGEPVVEEGTDARWGIFTDPQSHLEVEVEGLGFLGVDGTDGVYQAAVASTEVPSPTTVRFTATDEVGNARVVRLGLEVVGPSRYHVVTSTEPVSQLRLVPRPAHHLDIGTAAHRQIRLGTEEGS